MLLRLARLAGAICCRLGCRLGRLMILFRLPFRTAILGGSQCFPYIRCLPGLQGRWLGIFPQEGCDRLEGVPG